MAEASGRGRGGAVGQALQLGGVGVEHLFDLADEDGGLHGLDEHLVGADVGPVVVGEGGEQGDGGVVGSGAGGLDDIAAGGIALHAHVGDDHLVLAQLDLGPRFARAGGGIHIKSADLEHGLHGQRTVTSSSTSRTRRFAKGVSPSSPLRGPCTQA